MTKSVNLLYGLHILGNIGIGLKGGENKRIATMPVTNEDAGVKDDKQIRKQT